MNTIHNSSDKVIPFRRPPEVSDKKTLIRQKLAWIESVSGDLRLSALAARLGVWLITKYVNRISGDAWPSQPTLAADLNVSRSSIQRALNKLAAARYLSVVVYKGREYTNRYRPIYASPMTHLDDKTLHSRSENASNGASKMRHPRGTEPLLREPILREPIKEEVSANGSYEGRKKQAAEPEQLAAVNLAAPMNGSSNGTLSRPGMAPPITADVAIKALQRRNRKRPPPEPCDDPEVSF